MHIRTFHFLRHFKTHIKFFGNASLTFKFFNFIGKQFRMIFNCILKNQNSFSQLFCNGFHSHHEQPRYIMAHVKMGHLPRFQLIRALVFYSKIQFHFRLIFQLAPILILVFDRYRSLPRCQFICIPSFSIQKSNPVTIVLA